MVDVVCLDTQIIIWGIKKQSIPAQTEMIYKSARLIQNLKESRAKILIPTPVIFELLLPIVADKREKFLSFMNRNFMVIPFDAKSAVFASRIRQEKMDAAMKEAVKGDANITRNHIKVDCMIVAAAYVYGASIIYSHDDHVTKFASGYIPVEKIPDMPFQAPLFDTQAF